MAKKIVGLEDDDTERVAVCRRLHRLSSKVRGRYAMDRSKPLPPRELLDFAISAAQPDNKYVIAKRGRTSTAAFAAGLAELEAWCVAHGVSTAVGDRDLIKTIPDPRKSS